MLFFPAILGAQGNSWNKISYLGGTLQAKVSPYDWNTTLTVTPQTIKLVIAHGRPVEIAARNVTALSYGEEAHRRVGEMVAIGIMTVNPAALFGILHKSKEHFIGIEFLSPDGKAGSVLLEAHKDNYQAVLEALKQATGKRVDQKP